MQLVAQGEERRKTRPLAIGQIVEQRLARAQLGDVDELAADLGKSAGRFEKRMKLFLR